MSNQNMNGCGSCLGTLFILALISSLLCGGGILMRVGSWNFLIGKSLIDREQMIKNYHLDDLTLGREASEAAVKDFHNQLALSQYQVIYSRADEVFKKNTTQAQFISICKNIKLNFGSEKSTGLADWWGNSASSNNGRYILIRYITTFSNSP